jgi:hypothetical protein
MAKKKRVEEKEEDENLAFAMRSDERQRRVVARADAWTRNQAERLGVSVGFILDTVKRGHTPDMIEGYSNSQSLNELSVDINFRIVGFQKVRTFPAGHRRDKHPI